MNLGNKCWTIYICWQNWYRSFNSFRFLDWMYLYSISQEMCTRLMLCCALLWLYNYSHGNVHHSYSKELTMSWSRSVWLFCLDITYGQSREGHVFDHVTFWLDHVSWSDRCVHGLNMTRCIEQYKSQLQADHDLASSDRFIRHRSLAPALTATCPLFPCMSVGHAYRQCWCACDDSTI